MEARREYQQACINDGEVLSLQPSEGQRLEPKTGGVYMSLLFVFLCLFNQAAIDRKQDQPSVRIFVVSQQKFKNRGHHPENNRRVIFKMINESNKPVIVYGLSFEGEFEPTGYIMDFDKSTGKWLYPTPDNRPITWNDISDLEKEKYILQPGKAIKFEAEMSLAEVGKHFRRIVFVSFREREEPREIRGEEFVLK